MRGETVLRCEPSESTEDYIARLVADWPPLTGEQRDRLRTLLRADTRTRTAQFPTPRLPARQAA